LRTDNPITIQSIILSDCNQFDRLQPWLNPNPAWRCMTLELAEPHFWVANLPESTVLIKSTTSASFQANSITVPSFESLPYSLPHSIWPECTSLRSASDRLICSAPCLAGATEPFSYSSTTSRLVLVVRTVPVALIPSFRSWSSSLTLVKRLSSQTICLCLLKYRLPSSSYRRRSNTTACVFEKPFSFV